MIRHRILLLGPSLVIAAAAALLGAAPAMADARPVGPSAASSPNATCTPVSTLAGDHYSAVQIAQLAQQAGFTGNDWTVSVAIAEAESAGWTHATLVDSDCSVDRGLWQINSYWHSEVTDSCAFTPSCAAQATHTIWANGGWSQWTTYTNGAYLAHMSEAQAAVNQVSGGSGGGGGGGGGGSCYAAWSASTSYVPGNTVSYNGVNYTSLYWSTGVTPGSAIAWNIWQSDGAC
jgi:hypothetical protein